MTEIELFGTRLEELIYKKGLNKLKLAAIIQINPSCVCAYTRGRHAPCVDILMHIINALNLTAEKTHWLMTGK